MRPRFFFLHLILIVTTNCFSQEETFVTDVTKFTLPSPGISFEKAIGKRQTLKLEALLALSGYFSYSSTFGNSAGVNLDPAFEIQYRYYYNGARRAAKGKRTEMNSMNYFGAVQQSVLVKRIVYDTTFSKTKLRVVNSFGFVWGMQRNYPKRFSLDWNVGLGYAYGRQYSTYFNDQPGGFGERLFLIIGVDIGLWLNKRK